MKNFFTILLILFSLYLLFPHESLSADSTQAKCDTARKTCHENCENLKQNKQASCKQKCGSCIETKLSDNEKKSVQKKSEFYLYQWITV